MIPIDQFQKGVICVSVKLVDKDKKSPAPYYEILVRCIEGDPGEFGFRTAEPLQVGKKYRVGFVEES